MNFTHFQFAIIQLAKLAKPILLWVEGGDVQGAPKGHPDLILLTQ